MTGTSSGQKRNTAAGGYVAGSPAAPFPLDPLEYGNDAGKAEHRLWCGVLALMVQDGKRYWQGRNGRSATADDLEEAFDALCDCTWMLKRICEHTGHDAKRISRGFLKWCEDMA